MHRNDESNYFLYIEPTISEKSAEPLNDLYTEAVEFFLNRAAAGVSPEWDDLTDMGNREDFLVDDAWLGVHENCDGERSTNVDYLLENGYITNSLCVHYTRWFRNSITEFNLEKLKSLKILFLLEQFKQFLSQLETV